MLVCRRASFDSELYVYALDINDLRAILDAVTCDHEFAELCAFLNKLFVWLTVEVTAHLINGLDVLFIGIVCKLEVQEVIFGDRCRGYFNSCAREGSSHKDVDPVQNLNPRLLSCALGFVMNLSSTASSELSL